MHDQLVKTVFSQQGSLEEGRPRCAGSLLARSRRRVAGANRRGCVCRARTDREPLPEPIDAEIVKNFVHGNEPKGFADGLSRQQPIKGVSMRVGQFAGSKD